MSLTTAGFHPRRHFFTLLATQLLDGFGARFHGVLLALYMLRFGGLGSFAGFTAIGLVGVVLSTIAAGALTERLGGKRTMEVAGLVLAVSRVGTYALVGLGAGVAPLLVLRLVGATAGSLLVNGAKAQVDDRGAATSLAWMSVANGLGQALATACAAAAAMLPPFAIALLGVPTAVLATLPMMRLARFAVATTVPLRAQLNACRGVAPVVTLAAAIQLCIAGIASLKDGLTVDLYSARWLGPVAVATLAGSVIAAFLLPQVSRLADERRLDGVVWPLLGALAVSGWAVADFGPLSLLASQLVGGVAGQVLAVISEARILGDAGRKNAVPALSVSGGAVAFAGALSAAIVPTLLARLGYAGATLTLVAPLLVLATWGALRAATARRVLVVEACASSPGTSTAATCTRWCTPASTSSSCPSASGTVLAVAPDRSSGPTTCTRLPSTK